MRALITLSIFAAAASVDLLAAEDEEDAIALIKSATFDVKKVEEKEVAGLVKRQWWEAAETLVLLSHEKSFDLSKHVREVVKQQRAKLDNLVQKLDPKHATIQQIGPAFQWAQNASAVFVQIKYAARWNAPGALDLNPLNVTFTRGKFILDGMGSHSGVTKQYRLDLDLLDFIDENRSFWQTGSVGKLTVTLSKLHAGKVWPRLLLDKSKKIGNMGVWSGMAEKQKESTPCQNSAKICAAQSKMYCVKTDRCVPAECSGCEDTKPYDSRCVGKPVLPTVGDITDKNGEKGKYSSTFTVSLSDEAEAADIMGYLSSEAGLTNVEKELDAATPPEPLFVVPMLGLEGYSVKLKELKLHENTNTLVVVARNAMKRRGTPLLKPITDAAVPTKTPEAIECLSLLRDKDGNLTGKVWVKPGEGEGGGDGFNIYAGKSAKTRLNRKVLATVSNSGKENLNVKIGNGATHLLAFPKNHHGEGSVFAAFELPPVQEVYRPVPKRAPASVDFEAHWRKDDGNLTGVVTVVPHSDIATPFVTSAYKVYAGKNDKDRVPNAEVLATADVTAPGANATVLLQTHVPSAATHLLVYPASEFGEAEVQTAVPLPPAGTVKAEL
jgi:hypothetical protein